MIRHQARIRLASAITLVLILVALATPGPVGAQPGASVAVQENSASGDFPHTLTFRLVATTDDEVATIQLFWKSAGSTALSLAEPAVHAGETEVDVTHTVDLTIDYIPPGLDIEYFWRITLTNGEVHETDRQTFFFVDQRFDWRSFQAGLVTVWWYEGSEEFAHQVAQSASNALLLLDREFGLTTSEPIRIMVYGRDRDFMSALRANSAEWIGGVAYSGLSHILAHIRPGGGADREIQRMIPHEISHVVVHHASRNPYNSPPPWLDEGLATYVQEVPDIRLDPVLRDAVEDGSLIPAPALKSSFPLDPDQALLSYAESLSLVDYLVTRYGSRTVGELVTSYTQELSHDEVIDRVLDTTMEQLDAEWKASLDYAGDRPQSETGAGDELSTYLLLGVIAAGAVFATLGFIAVLFWRTRMYATDTGSDDPVESAENPAE